MGIPLKGDFQISAKENIIEWGHHQFKIRPNKKICTVVSLIHQQIIVFGSSF